MKNIIIALINIYQAALSPVFKQLLGAPSMCRFSPSCSEYTKISIRKYGIIKGTGMGIARLMHCQPFYKNYGNI